MSNDSLTIKTESELALDTLSPEYEDGNIEYKRHLIRPRERKMEELSTQLKYRLIEGGGECFYEFGVEDDGEISGLTQEAFDASMECLTELATAVNATVIPLDKRRLSSVEDEPLYHVTILVRENEPEYPIDVQMALLGSVDAGKSSLLGTLITGHNDNGRGWSRQFVVNHRHELQSGQTSSIGFHIVGFDDAGESVTSSETRRTRSWKEITHQSKKLISFIDLCGHEKYFSTTISGVTGLKPEYAIILVESSKLAKRKRRDGTVVELPIEEMTEHHIALCKDNGVPFFFLLTKHDLGLKVPDIYNSKKRQLKKLIKGGRRGDRCYGLGRQWHEITSEEDLLPALNGLKCAEDGVSPVIPFMSISVKTGYNIDLLKKFLNMLPKRNKVNEVLDKPLRASLIERFKVEGIGSVAHVCVMEGIIHVGDTIYIGPNSIGNFREAKVRTLEYKRNRVQSVPAGRYATVNIGKFRNSWLRKGMLIVHNPPEVQVVTIFEADIKIKSHSATIRPGYECPIHIDNVRQTARIMDIYNEDKLLRSQEKGKVKFKFIYNPAAINVGARLVFRESKTKGVGIITKLLE